MFSRASVCDRSAQACCNSRRKLDSYLTIRSPETVYTATSLLRCKKSTWGWEWDRFFVPLNLSAVTNPSHFPGSLEIRNRERDVNWHPLLIFENRCLRQKKSAQKRISGNPGHARVYQRHFKDVYVLWEFMCTCKILGTAQKKSWGKIRCRVVFIFLHLAKLSNYLLEPCQTCFFAISQGKK